MLAKRMPGTALRSLSHHMDLEWMREAYRRTRKDGAVGVDGVTADDFSANLNENLQELLDRAKAGTYRAPPVRRVEIPKGKGKTRAIGIPTFGGQLYMTWERFFSILRRHPLPPARLPPWRLRQQRLVNV